VAFIHCAATALDSHQSYIFHFGHDLLSFIDGQNPELRHNHVKINCEGAVSEFFVWCWHAYLERYPLQDTREFSKNRRRLRAYTTFKMLPKFIWSWYFRNNAAVIRHREAIRKMLQPRPEFLAKPRDFRDNNLSSEAVHVGVHIRRGDYRTFRNGIWCFSDEAYIKFMQETRRALGFDNIQFVIVSDEPVVIEEFRKASLDAVVFVGDDYREELVMLSLCDCVLGPVSTFSWNAAFIGNSKYRCLRGVDDSIVSAAEFKRVESNEFEADMLEFQEILGDKAIK